MIKSSFQQFVQTHCNKDARILIAISGGVDSVVLAHLFCDLQIFLGLHISFAHVNYQLRPEANGDESFVMALAKKYNVPYHTITFDTLSLSKEKGMSIQMVARDLRYQWFENLCATHQYDYIATAHHLNDSIETSLFNFTKGTGIRGIRGILSAPYPIIRPLSNISKSQILTFAKEYELRWREDASNTQNKYARNLIRNKVLPLLSKINPNLEHSYLDTQKRLRGTELILLDYINTFKQQHLTVQKDYIELKTDALLTIDHDRQSLILYEVLKPYGFSFVVSKDIADALTRHSGKQFSSDKYILVKDRDRLVITLKNDKLDTNSIILDFNKASTVQDLHWEFIPIDEDFELPREANIACVDWDKCQGEVTLRVWKEGDRFSPLGMRGKKKLSDFLTEQKIPLNLKSKVKIILVDDKIMWVVGHRVDDKYKITKKSNTALIITYEKKSKL